MGYYESLTTNSLVEEAYHNVDLLMMNLTRDKSLIRWFVFSDGLWETILHNLLLMNFLFVFSDGL